VTVHRVRRPGEAPARGRASARRAAAGAAGLAVGLAIAVSGVFFQSILGLRALVDFLWKHVDQPDLSVA